MITNVLPHFLWFTVYIRCAITRPFVILYMVARECIPYIKIFSSLSGEKWHFNCRHI